ncbi:hypothetical protein AB0C27_53865 [Nonomuraea sp. NPDC048882]|uniref:hypothetical protein n=1 Tax=Nonomuraea sp. NPDC048882 TaxID=3154347 RepID=UPI0033E5CBC8
MTITTSTITAASIDTRSTDSMTPSPGACSDLQLTRQIDARTGMPWTRTQTRVLGEAQIRIFEALCRITGRRPHELATDLVLQALRELCYDPEVQKVIAEISEALADPDRGPWCRMCGCTDEAACAGGCAWTPDPLLLGDLCSACLPRVTRAVGEISEAAAIGELLEYLPHADAAELMTLARTCPADHIAHYAVQAGALLEGLRAELTAVVTDAHQQAQAAEKWLAELESDDGIEASATTLGVV